MSDILIATTSFTAHVDGRTVSVRKGVTRVRAGHPIMKGRERHFAPIGVHFDIEQATAAPGERRAAPELPASPYPRHVGGGTWETPDGERHRGRDAAEAHMAGEAA